MEMSIKRARVDVDPIEGQADSRSNCKHQTIIDSALSNCVILKEIFKNLSYPDLLNCSKVSETWLNFLDPLVCYIGIIIKTGKATRRNTQSTARIEIQEILGINGICKVYRTNLQDLTSKLRVLQKHHLISIELQLSLSKINLNLDRTHYLAFLREFGDKIYTIDYQSNPYPFDFGEYLCHLSFLSKVEIVKWHRLNFYHLTDDLTEVLAIAGEISLPHVRKIYFGDSVDLRYWECILSVCDNVKEILEVPLKARDLIDRFGKTQCVKSIMYSFVLPVPFDLDEDESTIESLLERFATLGVNLTAAAVPSIYHLMGSSPWDPDSNHAQNLRKFTHQILESSKDSAIYMTIPAAKSGDFYFPMDFQMPSVKILQFEDDSHGLEYKTVPWNKKEMHRLDEESEYHYFPPGTNILSLFPSVEGLEIKFEMLKRHVIKFFPLKIFGPQSLGSSIKKLKIHGTSPDSFPHLIKIFPHVTHLEMESTLTHFNLVFPIISNGWKNLESLTVFMDSSKGFHIDSKGSNLDSVLTGIPENICGELSRGRKSRKNFTREEVMKLQRIENSILNLKDLRQLQFIVEGLDFFCGICCKDHVPHFITGMTADYAFKLLPRLEVSVRMLKGLKVFDELINALEPVADFVQMDNKYIPPEFPFL